MRESDSKQWLVMLAIAAVLSLLLYLFFHGSRMISAGDWVEVLGLKVPIPDEKSFKIVRMREGSGSEVQHGDLVKISLHVLKGCYSPPRSVKCYDRHEVWVYSGGVVGERPHVSNSFEPYLGTVAFRNALPGRKVGDRFLMSDYPHGTYIPAKGLSLVRQMGVDPVFFYSKWEIAAEQQGADRASDGHVSRIGLEAHAILDVEVLESCPAKLLSKQVSVREIGFERGSLWLGDGPSYKASIVRHSYTQFGAIEARCPGSEKPLWIEAGPTCCHSEFRESGGDDAVTIPVSDAVYVRDDRNRYSSRPKNEQDRFSAPQELAAGFLWSIEHGVGDERECEAAPLGFHQACREYVRLHPVIPLTSEKLAQMPPGMPRLIDEVKVLGIVSHQDSVIDLQLSPDGKTLLSRTSDSADLWNVETGRQKKLYRDKDDAKPFAMTFSPDGKILASVALSRDGQKLVSGKGWTIDLWDASPAGQVTQLPASEIRWIRFSQDGRSLTGIALDYSVWRWPLLPEGVPQHLPIDSQRPVKPQSYYSEQVAALSKDQKLLAIATREKEVQVWNVSQKKLLHTLALDGEVESLSFSPNAKSLLIAGPGLHLLSIATGVVQPLISERGAAGIEAEFFPNGKFLAVSGSAQVAIWDVKSLKEIARLELPQDAELKRSYSKFAISPNGKSIATIERRPDTGKIRLWTLTSVAVGK